jgi:hypothetical protein
MYRPAGPTWKISNRTQTEIREIHRVLPVMLLFFFAESDVDGPGQGHALDLAERVMRMSSSLVAPSAVAILSTALLCALGSTAVSQTAGSAASLPSVTVQAPSQVARHPHKPVQSANTGAVRRTGPATQTPTQTATRTPPPAPGSVMAKLAELERTSSNCTDGCQTSLRYGNQPWNGCSSTGDTFSPTCRNVRNFKTYSECTEHGLFIGWHRAAVWGYCTSLLAGGKLAGEMLQVAELKRSGRRQ